MKTKSFLLLYAVFVLPLSPAKAVDYGELKVNGKRVTVCRVNVRKE